MIHYLATHDFVWINTTITGKALKFDYEALEECMAAQYSYGDSTNVTAQAGFLLDKVLTRRPFEHGNLRTAFIALLAFLTANKYGLKGSDPRVAEVVRAVAGRKTTAAEAIEEVAELTNLGLRPGVTLRTLVTHLINERKQVLRLLTEGDE